jgi:hypothetical protein
MEAVRGMNKKTQIISKIDSILNCDFEPQFEIKPLTDMPIGDNSLHYRISKGDNFVDFGVFDSEMAAYMWECPGEGRVFLKALEKHAQKNKLKLTIPTILNPKLEVILRENGYTMKEVPYMDDVCELWAKW